MVIINKTYHLLMILNNLDIDLRIINQKFTEIKDYLEEQSYL